MPRGLFGQKLVLFDEHVALCEKKFALVLLAANLPCKMSVVLLARLKRYEDYGIYRIWERADGYLGGVILYIKIMKKVHRKMKLVLEL